MRIVLDTNVLVSALLNPHGPPAAVLRLVAGGGAVLLFDARILAEYREVLLRPELGLDTEAVTDLLALIEATGEPVQTSPLALSLVGLLPDPDDLPFLEVAITGCANALVTGNLRHFPAQAAGQVRISRPAELLR